MNRRAVRPSLRPPWSGIAPEVIGHHGSHDGARPGRTWAIAAAGSGTPISAISEGSIGGGGVIVLTAPVREISENDSGPERGERALRIPPDRRTYGVAVRSVRMTRAPRSGTRAVP